ncbi:MAG TPA: 4-hydroxy-3-methylbut-2-enyl diphosphate reductase [Planctomycetaceae bacterium]|nr:4-hydroxy-3-methylbut-2-enyl diphosphate reductase [Planctomycetaceae bacterium]
MRILLASPRGFCAGVNMAIESLERAIDRFGTPIFVYHEIVHNRWVVERFRQKGVVFVDNLIEVPQGAHLLYSAHGVSPEVRREAERRGLHTIDATCPLVTKVHTEARRYAEAGHAIVLIGHRGHDEVVGVMGEAPEAIRLVGCMADVDRLDVPDPERLVYLTQTTLSIDEGKRIVERLKARFPKIVRPKNQDVCYATQNRQQAVKQLASEVDFALVVGSQNSSNSRRLAELCEAAGVVTRLVDGPADIDAGWFGGRETVLITAGASAPEDVVQACVELLREHFEAPVESRDFGAEEVRFVLPRELRDRPTVLE